MERTIVVGTAIVTALPLIPLGHFWIYGWAARKQQIISRFTDRSIESYRQIFYPMSNFANNQQFGWNYDDRYGRQLYFFPILLFAVLVLLIASLSVSWVLSHDWSETAEGTAKVAIFSLAGAYVWVNYDLITRARQNDIVTSDINRATLRLLLSLPFGFAISAFAGVLSGTSVTLSTGALAFFVGAFPTDTVLKFMRRTAAVPLKLDADSTGENVKQLLDIDGVAIPIAERLIDEGVTTNVQLAYSDPILLTIKTGMDFSFILDITGQALVTMYFGVNQMKSVRKFGLRTSIEVRALNDTVASYDRAMAGKIALQQPAPPRNQEQVAAQAQLEALAAALGLDIASTRFILDQIASDPYTEFAWRIWGS